MLDRAQAPSADKGVKALTAASRAAGTPTIGAWAFYLGGKGHNKGRGSTYTNALLDALEGHSVRLLPIYVGEQGKLSRARGVSDANDAMSLNREFGNRNNMIVTDIERHTSDENPSAAVEYVNAWTQTLHAAGFRSMVYGSFNLAEDLGKRGQPKPDGIWVSRFRTHAAKPGFDPHRIPGVNDGAFDGAGQRAWQYGAKFADKKGQPEIDCVIEGINVDVSVIDADVFGDAPGDSVIAAHAVQPARVTEDKPATGPRRHTIAPKENLSVLEKRFGLPQGSLFKANKEAIEAAARAHGKPNSRNGHDVFPGTVITIP
jgi:hypothetical protein